MTFEEANNSLEDYITKLDDGTFEVRIPVPDNLKGKNLVAYYTSSDGKTEEYKVEVKDGYAIFKTKHFSIYTLAESEVKNGNNNENNGNTEINDNNNENTETFRVDFFKECILSKRNVIQIQSQG